MSDIPSKLPPNPPPWVSRFTVARLYNLGDYEHKRIEIVVECPPGTNVGATMAKLEAILERFDHVPPNNFDQYPLSAFIENQKMTLDEWQSQYPPANYPGMDPPKWKEVFDNEAKAIALARQENTVWESTQALLREHLNKLGTVTEQ